MIKLKFTSLALRLASSTLCFSALQSFAAAQSADTDGWVDLEDFQAAQELGLPTATPRRHTDAPQAVPEKTTADDDGWVDLESFGAASSTSQTSNPETRPSPAPESGWVDLDELTRAAGIEQSRSPRNKGSIWADSASSAALDMNLSSGQLIAGDWIDIQFDKAASLSGEYRISEIGTLSLPHVGNLRADGQTAEQFAAVLEQLYGADYLVDPQITVTPRARIIGQIALSGLVNASGEYSVTSAVTLADALSKGGGVRGGQSGRDAIVLRKTGVSIRARRIELDSIDAASNPGLSIFPGDEIEIIERAALPDVDAQRSDFPLLKNVLDGGAAVKF